MALSKLTKLENTFLKTFGETYKKWILIDTLSCDEYVGLMYNGTLYDIVRLTTINPCTSLYKDIPNNISHHVICWFSLGVFVLIVDVHLSLFMVILL